MPFDPRRRSQRSAWLALLGLVLGAALFMLVDRGASAQSPSPSGEVVRLRLGWTESPLNLNPFVGYSNSYEVWMLNYDTLVGVGADGLPSKETGLAEDWHLSEDETVWTFKIREGVKWHDGTPLTARDVAFTFNYIIDNELSLSVYLKDVEKAVALDDTTLEVTCTHPKANMLLTQVYIYVLPEHIWSKIPPEKANNSFRNDPPIIGSGPFQTVEFKKDGYVKMVRVPGYWGGEPTLDEVIFQYYTTADTMVQDLKNGVIDGAQVIPPEQFELLESEPHLATIAYPLYYWEYIDINCYDSPDSLGHPALRDPRFRVALAWAIDREKCADLAWKGLADAPGTGLFPKEGWPESFDPYYEPAPEEMIGFDLDKARRLLDEAGYSDSDGDGIREYEGEPIKLRLWSRQISPQSQVQGKLIAGWLKDIGLDIQYTAVDEGALGDAVWNYEGDTFAPDYDLALWDFMGYIDPGDSAACFTTDQIENYNEMCWSNAEYDRLIVEQYREMDTARRVELLKQAQAVMYAEQPMIVIDYPFILQAVNTEKWEGWAPYVEGSVWNNFLYRGSYLDLKPKAAAAANGDSSTTAWIIAGALLALAAVGVVVWIRARGGRRVIEE